MRRATAIIGTLVLPGWGHFLLGRWQRGALWFAFALLVVFAAPLGVRVWLPALLLTRIAPVVDVIFAAPGATLPGAGLAVAAFFGMAIAGPLVVQVPVRRFVVEAYKIPAGSMIPTLQVGDHVFVRKYPFAAPKPARGDVIVFKYPKAPDKDFVKRVVATPGDTIEIRANRLVVNGSPVEQTAVPGPCEYEDYDELVEHWEPRRCVAFTETLGSHRHEIVYDAGRAPSDWPERMVPAGSYFVMGDNRDNSHDSRYWGTVPLELVKGTVDEVWFSTGSDGVRWDRIGLRVE